MQSLYCALVSSIWSTQLCSITEFSIEVNFLWHTFVTASLCQMYINHTLFVSFSYHDLKWKCVWISRLLTELQYSVSKTGWSFLWFVIYNHGDILFIFVDHFNEGRRPGFPASRHGAATGRGGSCSATISTWARTSAVGDETALQWFAVATGRGRGW